MNSNTNVSRRLGVNDNATMQRVEINSNGTSSNSQAKRKLGLGDDAKPQKIDPNAGKLNKKNDESFIPKPFDKIIRPEGAIGLVHNTAYLNKTARTEVLSAGYGNKFWRLTKASGRDIGSLTTQVFRPVMWAVRNTILPTPQERDAIKNYKANRDNGIIINEASKVDVTKPKIDITFKPNSFNAENTKFDYRGIEKMSLVKPGESAVPKMLDPLENMYRLQDKVRSPSNGLIYGDQFVSLEGKEGGVDIRNRRFRSNILTATEDGIAMRKPSIFPAVREFIGLNKPAAIQLTSGQVLPKGYNTFYPSHVLPDVVKTFNAFPDQNIVQLNAPKNSTPVVDPVVVQDTAKIKFVSQGATIKPNAEGTSFVADNKRTSTPFEFDQNGKITPFVEPINAPKTAMSRLNLSTYKTSYANSQAIVGGSRVMRGLGVVGIALSIYSTVSTSFSEGDALTKGSDVYNRNKRGVVLNLGGGYNIGLGRESAKNAAGIAAAVGGGKIGGGIGAAIGTAIFPGVGTTIGLVVGMFIGGAIGYWGGSEVADKGWTAGYGEKG